jgi:thioredoxin 1
VEEDPELSAIRARIAREMMAAPPAGRPLEVTDATFDRFVKEHPVAVVDVWAEWCGPCRIVGPIVDQLAREWAGKVAFAKLDADANPRVMDAFGIQGIPTLLVFRDGRHADSIVGAMPKPQLAARIQASGR